MLTMIFEKLQTPNWNEDEFNRVKVSLKEFIKKE